MSVKERMLILIWFKSSMWSNLCEESFASNLWKGEECTDRLGELKWVSLEQRHKYLSLVKMYKISTGYCDMDAAKFYDVIGSSQTRGNHDFKLRLQPFCTNNYFKHFNCYVSYWNSPLSKYVICESSLNSFKVSFEDIYTQSHINSHALYLLYFYQFYLCYHYYYFISYVIL